MACHPALWLPVTDRWADSVNEGVVHRSISSTCNVEIQFLGRIGEGRGVGGRDVSPS